MAELTAAAGPWEPPPEPELWQADSNDAVKKNIPAAAGTHQTLNDFIRASLSSRHNYIKEPLRLDCLLPDLL
jgi:hypothetical protein